MVVVVQRIEITWPKRARGAHAAKDRRALPRSTSVSPPSGAALWLQRLAMSEHDGYALRTIDEEAQRSVPRHLHELDLSLNGDELRIGVQWTHETGAPQRPAVRVAAKLRAGETLRVTTNGRHSGWDAAIWYRSAIYNVAFAPSVEPNVFARTPTYEHDFQADVF